MNTLGEGSAVFTFAQFHQALDGLRKDLEDSRHDAVVGKSHQCGVEFKIAKRLLSVILRCAHHLDQFFQPSDGFAVNVRENCLRDSYFDDHAERLNVVKDATAWRRPANVNEIM